MRSLLLAAAAVIMPAPALAAGQVTTIARGIFKCELPGDAAGEAGLERPDESFTIVRASRYRSPQGDGTYVRRGNMLEMTSGPRNGERYQILSERYLRKLEDGKPGRLRCIRQRN